MISMQGVLCWLCDEAGETDGPHTVSPWGISETNSLLSVVFILFHIAEIMYLYNGCITK